MWFEGFGGGGVVDRVGHHSFCTISKILQLKPKDGIGIEGKHLDIA
jgi:hypothetical protein